MWRLRADEGGELPGGGDAGGVVHAGECLTDVKGGAVTVVVAVVVGRERGAGDGLSLG